MNIRCFGLICALCLLPGFGLAQQNAPASKSAPQAGANRSITLDVYVTDKAGQPVADLQQKDFTLTDNKQIRDIVSFSTARRGTDAADPPVEVILLVDEVNAPFILVASEWNEIGKFLRRNGGELDRPVSLAFLSDAGLTIATAPSQDAKVVLAELNQNKHGLRGITRSQGYYGAEDRLWLSLRALKRLANYGATRPGRKLVVWISPGWPLLSVPNREWELTMTQRRRFFKSAVVLSDVLRNARITLYAVDPAGLADAVTFRAFAYESFLKPVTAADRMQFGNLALQVLALQSGGKVLNSSNDVGGEIAACVADANAFYTLSFEGVAGNRPNEYHALEIKIDKPGLKVRMRSGYYAQP